MSIWTRLFGKNESLREAERALKNRRKELERKVKGTKKELESLLLLAVDESLRDLEPVAQDALLQAAMAEVPRLLDRLRTQAKEVL